MKFQQCSAEVSSSRRPTALTSPSIVDSPGRLRPAFSGTNAFSIGVKSGEYGGRWSRLAPVLWRGGPDAALNVWIVQQQKGAGALSPFNPCCSCVTPTSQAMSEPPSLTPGIFVCPLPPHPLRLHPQTQLVTEPSRGHLQNKISQGHTSRKLDITGRSPVYGEGRIQTRINILGQQCLRNIQSRGRI